MYVIRQICIAFTTLSIFPIFLFTNAFAVEYFTEDSKPLGKPYSQWFEEWLKWWFLTDKDDLTSKLKNNNCIAKLDGPVVFFMSPTWAGPNRKVMSCEISSQQPIFFTFLTGECDTELPDMKNATYEKLLKCAEEDNVADQITMTGSIDGVPIPQDAIKVIKTDKSNFDNFKLVMKPNNLFDGAPGTYNSAASGYLVLVKPLPVGLHTINQKTVVLGAPWAFTADIIYNLNVTK
jgi:hypothetical protein